MAKTNARTLIAATLMALKCSVRVKELITRRSPAIVMKFLNPTNFRGERRFHSKSDRWNALSMG